MTATACGVDDPTLPTGDRIAHLLLALRADEQGFATVANLAFSGAPLAGAPAPRRRCSDPPWTPRGAARLAGQRPERRSPTGGPWLASRRRRSMLAMPTPAEAAHRLMLVAAPRHRRPRNPDAPKIRRYRLARLQLNDSRAGAAAGTAHLRRMYD